MRKLEFDEYSLKELNEAILTEVPDFVRRVEQLVSENETQYLQREEVEMIREWRTQLQQVQWDIINKECSQQAN